MKSLFVKQMIYVFNLMDNEIERYERYNAQPLQFLNKRKIFISIKHIGTVPSKFSVRLCSKKEFCKCFKMIYITAL